MVEIKSTINITHIITFITIKTFIGIAKIPFLTSGWIASYKIKQIAPQTRENSAHM